MLDQRCNSQISLNKKQNRSNIRAKNQKIVNNTKPCKVFRFAGFFTLKNFGLYELLMNPTAFLLLLNICKSLARMYKAVLLYMESCREQRTRHSR